MIIGCCGAGKSTLAANLHDITQLPLIHLDQHYWLPNWTEPSKEVWNKKVASLVKGENWIIDGNYSSSMDLRIARADTIIYLDYPTWRCLWRVIKRVSRYHGRRRPDMPEDCNERFDIDFLHYVLTFNIRKRKSTLRRLNAVSDRISIITLKSDQEVAKHLATLTS